MTRAMPRVQEVLVPTLRIAFPSVSITTWIPDVDKRNLPLVNIRRVGGTAVDVQRLDNASIEIAAHTREGLVDTEDLYLNVREVVWHLVADQTVTDAGYFHSFRETIGPMTTESPFENSWRVQGVIQLGLRPART